MGKLVIDNPAPKLLVQIGDDLLENGKVAEAMTLYNQALAVCDATMRPSVVARLGLAEHGKIAARPLEVLHALERLFPDRQVFVGHGMALWFKHNAFLNDARFMALVEKHKQLLPLPNWHWNLNTAVWAARQALKAEGDFVELGVFKGHTTLFLADYLDFQNQPRRWFLYDTFDGIPDDQLNAGWDGLNQNIYKGTYSYEEVRDRFAGYPNIEVIKGRVPEILEERCPETIAFVHLDMNSAAAEVAGLEFIYDRLSPGGIILLDDYCWQTAYAQHVAEKRWFEARGLHVLELPTGQGVFVKTAA